MNEVKQFYKENHDDYDKWSSSLIGLFNIAEVLYVDEAVPEHWEYNPGLGAVDLSENMYSTFTTADLIYWGNVLNRYKNYLDKKGLSY